jgi:hypothetical protein
MANGAGWDAVVQHQPRMSTLVDHFAPHMSNSFPATTHLRARQSELYVYIHVRNGQEVFKLSTSLEFSRRSKESKHFLHAKNNLLTLSSLHV